MGPSNSPLVPSEPPGGIPPHPTLGSPLTLSVPPRLALTLLGPPLLLGEHPPQVTLLSLQEDSLNIKDLSTLRAPLDIPIPDPPPKDEDEVSFGVTPLPRITPHPAGEGLTHFLSPSPPTGLG